MSSRPRWIWATGFIAADFAFKGVDERAEFCDVPLFSGDKNILNKALGSPDGLHPPGLA